MKHSASYQVKLRSHRHFMSVSTLQVPLLQIELPLLSHIILTLLSGGPLAAQPPKQSQLQAQLMQQDFCHCETYHAKVCFVSLLIQVWLTH